MSSGVNQLGALMAQRKQSTAQPYVLLLGAGTSVSAGLPTYGALADTFLKRFVEDQWQELRQIADPEERVKAAIKGFHEAWRSMAAESCRAFLDEQLAGEPSEGHAHLASLVKQGHLRLILSTNLDTLVEQWGPAMG